MKDVVAFVAEHGGNWVIVGKGPSLDHRARFRLSSFKTLTLNHACLLVPPFLAHFTDLEAFLDCAAVLDAAHVVLPWYPHVAMTPGRFSLSELCEEYSLLAELRASGRLVAYNSTRVPRGRYAAGLSEVRVRFFSAVPAFNILAAAGVKPIYSIGVDGGTKYASGLDLKDRLANGRNSFDAQFAEIAKTCKVYATTHVRLA